MSKKKEPFERIPEFLAAVKNIQDHGFFTQSKLEYGTSENPRNPMNITFTITGRIPNNRRSRRAKMKVAIDPEKILRQTRKLVSEGVFTNPKVFLKIETKEWDRWDRSGNRVIGSKGSQIHILLDITLHHPRKKT